ncbi:MAG: hypothetical protein RJQ00_08305 [Vicingaceae bacterium]
MKYTNITFFLFLGLFACNQVEEKKPVTKAEDQEAIEALNLKLDATEAQLYNVRVELAKCKGDSLPEAETP